MYYICLKKIRNNKVDINLIRIGSDDDYFRNCRYVEKVRSWDFKNRNMKKCVAFCEH